MCEHKTVIVPATAPVTREMMADSRFLQDHGWYIVVLTRIKLSPNFRRLISRPHKRSNDMYVIGADIPRGEDQSCG